MLASQRSAVALLAVSCVVAIGSASLSQGTTLPRPQGQRISMLLKRQDFREEVRVHHAPHHLAA